MIKDIIIAALVAQGVASTVIAYKNYKAVKGLEAKINQSTGVVEELKDKIDGAGKSISKEIRNEVCNLSFMGIKIK